MSQDSRIANSDLFNGFLLSAQKETRKEDPTEVQLHVFLMNGHKITVDIMSTDQTDDCLEVKICFRIESDWETSKEALEAKTDRRQNR